MKALACVTVIAAAASVGLAGVNDPWLTTDKSVDTRSAQTIVAGLVRPEMTDEQKVLTLFNWLRRAVYHSGPEEPLRHDFNLMVSVFGYGSCYMQTHPLSHLLHQCGYPTRNWIHNTHHMLEVYYGGAWHCMDPHMTFYAYNRATPPVLASVAELRADEAIAAKAVEEKRACPGFLLCGDKPTWFSGDDKWTLDHPFLPHVGADQEFGGMRLPRGAKFVRTWKEGAFLASHAFGKGVGPYHTCGAGADRKDPINWPFWEPYVEKGHGRHHGTGYLEYQPDLGGGGWADGALRHINLASRKGGGPALGPVAADIEAEVIFHVDLPYVVTAASLAFDAAKADEKSEIAVSASTKWAGQNRVWKTVEGDWSGAAKADLTPLVEGSVGGYWLRITMKSSQPAKTGISNLKLRTDFQLNPYALPYLVVGSNKIRATAARADGPWNLRIAWSEGENWQKSREHKARIEGTVYEAMIDAAGPKLPRMEAIEISVEP